MGDDLKGAQTGRLQHLGDAPTSIPNLKYDGNEFPNLFRSVHHITSVGFRAFPWDTSDKFEPFLSLAIGVAGVKYYKEIEVVTVKETTESNFIASSTSTYEELKSAALNYSWGIGANIKINERLAIGLSLKEIIFPFVATPLRQFISTQTATATNVLLADP